MISLTIAVLLTVGELASAGDVPDFIHICKRTDPKLDDCMVESIMHIRPYLKEGIPEFNIPAMEPLTLDELVAVQGGGIKMSGKDIKVWGGSDFTISNVHLVEETLTATADVSHPNLYILGTYDIEGKLLLLPLTGSGPMQGNFTGCFTKVRMEFVLKKNKAGEDHLVCTNFVMNTTVTKGHLQFDNLFGGDKVLGDVINTAINDNFDVLLKELKPLLEKTISNAMKNIANKVLVPFTWQQLFPDK